MSQGLAASQSGKWDLALKSYGAALEMNPRSAKAYCALADVLAIRGQLRSAVQVYFQLADIQIEVGDFEAAVETAYWVLQLHPQSLTARMKIILAYTKAGNSAQVVKSSLELARLLVELGRANDALDLLRSSQQLDPYNPEISAEMGEIFFMHGFLMEAAPHFRTAAQQFLNRGDAKKAVCSFHKMKSIVPEDSSVLLQPLWRIFSAEELRRRQANRRERRRPTET